MRVLVKLHAQAADLAGAREIALELPEAATGAVLKAAVVEAHPELAGLAERSAVASSTDYLRDAAPLAGADEVHLIPPVSGG